MTDPNPHKHRSTVPDLIIRTALADYTMVPNDVLRNPNLSEKAKGLLAHLLSNREGWHSYMETLIAQSKDGESAIRSGLNELETENYLLRITYRDITTKIIQGTLWAYTDDRTALNPETFAEELHEYGMEPLPINAPMHEGNEASTTERGKSARGKSARGKSARGKPRSNNTKIKILREKEYIEPHHASDDNDGYEDNEANEKVPLENNDEKVPLENNDASNTKEGTIPLFSDEEIPSSKHSRSTDPLERTCQRIIRYWRRNASHIHNPREASIPAMMRAIASAVKKYGASNIITAIDHYLAFWAHQEALPRSKRWYDKKWTLQAFLQQSNGAPRFVEGIDSKYDGDLWRKFAEDHLNDVDASPTTRYTRVSARAPSVEDIINRALNSAGPYFMDKIYTPSEAYLASGGVKPDRGELAKALVQMYHDVRAEQERNGLSPEEVSKRGYNPLRLIEEYVDWLRDQAWITNPRLSLFQVDSPLFRRNFCGQYAKERDWMNRDPLTGRSRSSE
jgi:hypothetical protein